MKSLLYISALLITCLSQGVHAKGLQEVDGLSLSERQQIERSITLLKNEGNILPIQRLDTISVTSIYSGKSGDIFQERIDSYKESNHFSISEFTSNTEIGNLIVIGVDSLNESVDRLIITLQKKLDQKPQASIVLVSVSLDVLDYFEPLSNFVEGAIKLSEENSLSYDLAIQGIFGAIGFKGKIDVGPSDEFKWKWGVDTKAIDRLKYTIPEEIGIDAKALKSGISQIVKEAMDSSAFPGCQLLVAKEGKVVFLESYGYHTYKKENMVSKSDIYDLASVTKVTGATTALMKLHGDGNFELDTKFSKYWPAFEKGNKSEMSVRNVLAHNARLLPYISYYSVAKKKNGKYRGKTIKSDSSRKYPIRISNKWFMHKDFREKKIYDAIRKTPLNEEAGYRYSGLSFYLYPDIVANLSGQPFEDFLSTNFFEPLGTTTLGYNPANKFPLDRIIPTEDDDYFRNELLHGVVHDEGAVMMEGVSGNAGLFSNANDLAKLWQMYLNGGKYGGHQYLSESTIYEFTRCQYCDDDNRRGLGFDKPLIEYDSTKSSVAKKASKASYGHSGYTGTLVWADPENQLLFVFLSNRVHPTRENRKVYEMNIRPRIHSLIYSLLP